MEFDLMKLRISMITLAAALSFALAAPAAAAPTGERFEARIAYADLDDEPVREGRAGWISQFHRNLELRVAQLAGAAVKVIKQSDPSQAGANEARILERVPDVKTIVTVLSPPFVRSDGCRRRGNGRLGRGGQLPVNSGLQPSPAGTGAAQQFLAGRSCDDDHAQLRSVCTRAGNRKYQLGLLSDAA